MRENRSGSFKREAIRTEAEAGGTKRMGRGESASPFPAQHLSHLARKQPAVLEIAKGFGRLLEAVRREPLLGSHFGQPEQEPFPLF